MIDFLVRTFLCFHFVVIAAVDGIRLLYTQKKWLQMMAKINGEPLLFTKVGYRFGGIVPYYCYGTCEYVFTRRRMNAKKYADAYSPAFPCPSEHSPRRSRVLLSAYRRILESISYGVLVHVYMHMDPGLSHADTG